jgi:hypothetical protein
MIYEHGILVIRGSTRGGEMHPQRYKSLIFPWPLLHQEREEGPSVWHRARRDHYQREVSSTYHLPPTINFKSCRPTWAGGGRIGFIKLSSVVVLSNMT